MYKVIKKQRGQHGEWFGYTAMRFQDEREALAYAESFASAQRAAGVTGTRVVVLRGDDVVAQHNVNRGDVPADRSNASSVYA